MKILFISPNEDISYIRKISYLPLLIQFKIIRSPPLTFGALSAVTPKEHTITFIDDKSQKIDFKIECDIVGITVVTPTAVRAYQIADEFRKRGKTVVLGGWHASALPEEAKQHADAVVVGEGDLIWSKLLKDFKEGKLKDFYFQNEPIDLANIPNAKWDFKHKCGNYSREIQTMRGCSVKCEYCSITNFPCGSIPRYRPIDKVVNELENLPQKLLIFDDPSFTCNINYSKQLFRAMKNMNKKILCNGNIGVLYRNPELLKLASEAGCIRWLIGFESVSEHSLKFLGKTTNYIKDYKPATKLIHDYGMEIEGSFMVGLEGDTKDIFDETLNEILDWDMELAHFNLFTPFPGTPIYNKFELEDRILTKDWTKYNFHNVVYKPKNMTGEDLLNGYKRINEEFFSTKNFIKRWKKCSKMGFFQFISYGFDHIMH